MVIMFLLFFFFFQAQDGIRDKLVTGVQTCALPISGRRGDPRRDASGERPAEREARRPERPAGAAGGPGGRWLDGDRGRSRAGPAQYLCLCEAEPALSA